MNFEYQVLDNLIPTSYQDVLLDMFDPLVAQWAYLPNLSGDIPYDPNDKNVFSSLGFSQKIYRADKNYSNKNWEFSAPLLWFLEHRTGIKIKSVVRAHTNLMVPVGNQNPELYNEPHIDNPDPTCLSMVYYIADSDGDTRVFNKTGDEGYYDLKVIHRESPKKGNALIFPSNRFHSSTPPIKHSSRLILNFVVHVE